MRFKILLILLILFNFAIYSLYSQGTSPTTKDQQQPTKAEKAEEKKSEESNLNINIKPEEITLPVINERKKLVYHNFGKRDPFAPLLAFGQTNTYGDKPSEVPISEMTLKGILELPNGNVAIFQLPNGKTWLLKENDKVLNGKIVKIDKDKVIFEKVDLDIWGRPKRKEYIEIKLYM